jgi:hypothetical protein
MSLYSLKKPVKDEKLLADQFLRQDKKNRTIFVLMKNYKFER